MRKRSSLNGNETLQDLLNSITERADFPSYEEIMAKEPHPGFNKLMELNGYWWSPYSPVIHVAVMGQQLIRIRVNGHHLFKTPTEFRTWIRKTGYEHENTPAE